MDAENQNIAINWEFAELFDKGLIIVDKDDKVLFINRQARSLLVFPADTKKSLKDFLRKDYEEVNSADIDLNLNKEIQIRKIRKKNVPHEVLSLNVRKVSEYSRAVVIEDITEDLYEERNKARFLSLISHKLRTPVVALCYSMNLCLHKDRLGFSEKEYNDFMEQAYLKSFELSELIEKIINYTMMDQNILFEEKELLSLEEVVDKAVTSYKSKYSSIRGDYDFFLKKDLQGENKIDKGHLVILIQNLLDNALKFSDKENPAVQLCINASENKTAICCTDDGPGIPDEFKEKVLTPFFQVEEFHTGNVEGVGLGLSLVQKIAEVYNGAVSIADSVHGGAEIKVILHH